MRPYEKTPLHFSPFVFFLLFRYFLCYFCWPPTSSCFSINGNQFLNDAFYFLIDQASILLLACIYHRNEWRHKARFFLFFLLHNNDFGAVMFLQCEPKLFSVIEWINLTVEREGWGFKKNKRRRKRNRRKPRRKGRKNKER